MSISVALDPNNSSAKNKLELEKALSSFDASGGEIRLPRSRDPFPIDPGIVWPTQRNITLVGEGRADAYEAAYAGTTLKFTTGTAAFDFSSFTPAGPYAAIENVSLDGSNLCEKGLAIHGKVHVRAVNVSGFTRAGIHLVNLINMTTLDEVSAVSNDDLGIWVGGEGATLNTIFTANALKVRSNGGAGLYFQNAMGWEVANSVIESNYGEGIVLSRPANIKLNDGVFENCWLENNARDAGSTYSVLVNGAASPERIIFRGGVISSSTGNKAVLLASANGLRFEDVKFSGDTTVDRNAGCVNTGFLNCNGHTLVGSGGAGNWDKSWVDVIAGLGGGGGGGGTPVSFHAHKGGTNQTVSANNTTKVTFPTEEFDTNNNFASSRFTPTVAGKYVISAAARCAVDSYCRVMLYKNSALYRGALNYANGSPTGTVTAIVDMNGTTDYLEVYALNASGTTIYGGADDTYFSGALVG